MLLGGDEFYSNLRNWRATQFVLVALCDLRPSDSRMLIIVRNHQQFTEIQYKIDGQLKSRKQPIPRCVRVRGASLTTW